MNHSVIRSGSAWELMNQLVIRLVAITNWFSFLSIHSALLAITYSFLSMGFAWLEKPYSFLCIAIFSIAVKHELDAPFFWPTAPLQTMRKSMTPSHMKHPNSSNFTWLTVSIPRARQTMVFQTQVRVCVFVWFAQQMTPQRQTVTMRNSRTHFLQLAFAPLVAQRLLSNDFAWRESDRYMNWCTSGFSLLV